MRELRRGRALRPRGLGAAAAPMTPAAMRTNPRVLDALIIGAGPSGLGASLALHGYRPHYTPQCTVESAALERRLRRHLGLRPDGLITGSDVPSLASGLRGRSNNPLALLFALIHSAIEDVEQRCFDDYLEEQLVGLLWSHKMFQ